ncbi:MAG: SusC/RagA family TonB-linked outer membrane protein [Tidjanibacter sp.]|nr:SusC/RagA family TonB-linked outer membrane protein [Tidjanibacter sp.]
MKRFYFFTIVAGLACTILSTTSLYGQRRTLEGRVTAASDGEGLIGVTVTIEGTSIGVSTSADGLYTLSADMTKEAVILFEYMGYRTERVVLGNRTKLDVQLVEAVSKIDDVVVIGYGKTTKKELTGSVASLKSDDFATGAFTSAAGLLQGKVAGLSVTNPQGGDPNAKFEILLRGTNTLSAGQGPLVIIDGVSDADIRNINFQEVESVDILKDGSAAAIYGTRGTNGVIIITTKRARAGDTMVEYDGQLSVQTVTRRAMPMTASQFESTINTYKPAASNSLYGGDTDWFDEITRNPVSHTHSLAVSGGAENFSHRTVMNIERNQGIQRKNDVEKYLVKTNIHQTALQGWLDLDYNLSASKRKYSPANYDAFRQAFFHNPTEPVYDPTNKESGGYYRVAAMDYFNPVAMVNETTAQNQYDNLNFSVRASLNILPVAGLKWDNFLVYNQERYEERSYRSRYYPSLIGKEGKADISNGYSADLQWESTFNYTKQFGAHSLQAIAGYTYQEGMSQSSSMSNFGYSNDLLLTNNIQSGSALKQGLAEMSSEKYANKYIAFFGRVMYNYDEKYLASVSLRRDGSSRFGSANKWGWFPAVSLGWRISREEFMQSVEWVDELKLRAGYGVTGNQDFGNYKSLLLMKVSDYGSFLNNGQWQNIYEPKSNANPDLGWEKKAELNVGLDFALFGNKIVGTIDAYSRRTTDLLYDYSVPVPPYDYKVLFTNVGEIRNNGIELTLSATPVRSGSFVWNTTATFAHNTNRLISFTNEEFKDADYKVGWLNTPVGVYCQRLTEGKSLGTFYGPKFLYVDDNGKDKLEGSIGGSVAESDWKPIGCAYPWLTIGWTNTFIYSNFDLNVVMRAQLGGKVFNTYAAEYENLASLGLRNILASWLDDTSFTGTDVTYSSKYLEDASYLKVDNISLGYNLTPKSGLIRSVRIYLSAQNLFCLTGYSGVDPEVSLSGLTPGIESTSYYPRTAIFTFGVNMKF